MPAAALAVLAVIVFLGAASVATDSSSFCGTCHEMGPHAQAWASGAHADAAECVDCHVDPGAAARLAHKPTVLGEVRAHFAGDTGFPRSEAPDVPNSRCASCHPRVAPADAPASFSHDAHADKGRCVQCHSLVGHAVTRDALAQAGVLDESAWTARNSSAETTAVVRVGGGSANVKEHPEVSCTSCHDLARSGCTSCHSAALPEKHPSSDTCSACHPSAASWKFAHPGERSRCAECHERPAEEHPARDDCGTCHSLRGGWAHDR